MTPIPLPGEAHGGAACVPQPAAMVLAAGRGERMRPLTDHCPKPLLAVQGRALIDWHLAALARDGVRRVVVNTAWLDHRIEDHLGRAGPPDLRGALSISYSHEGRDFGHALETAGGVARALPQLCPPGQEVFWLLAGDVYLPGFRFDPAAVARFAASDRLAHLWLVPNPPQHPQGDFGWQPRPDWGDGMGLALPHAGQQYTYSTIGLYRRALFEPPLCAIPAGNPAGVAERLAPLLRAAMAQGRVSAQRYDGPWTDVGTPERLAALNACETTP